MTRSAVQKDHVFQGKASADKYQSPNPLSQKLVSNFLSTLLDLVKRTGAREIHEIGCGEGQIMGVLARAGYDVRGCDLSADALAVARSETERAGLSITYTKKSIYDITPDVDSADLILCCEVLEHLTEPEVAFQKLLSVAKKDLIVSVPREPIWHILNMARGKYLTALGNTPGHYNHWSSASFVEFVSQYAEVVEVKKPLPWTMVWCRRL